MALRWRSYGRGPLLCAATHKALPDDSYIDDAVHYKLAVELRVVIPDENERENGVWYWEDQVKKDGNDGQCERQTADEPGNTGGLL